MTRHLGGFHIGHLQLKQNIPQVLELLDLIDSIYKKTAMKYLDKRNS